MWALLFDSVGHVLLMSFIPFDFYSPSSSSPVFHDLLGDASDGDLQFDSLSTAYLSVGVCTCSHLPLWWELDKVPNYEYIEYH